MACCMTVVSVILSSRVGDRQSNGLLIIFAVDWVGWMGGNSVLSEKLISFGILRWELQDCVVGPVSRLASSPKDVATDAFGDRWVWYLAIAAEYFDVPDFEDPREPLGLNLLAICGL